MCICLKHRYEDSAAASRCSPLTLKHRNQTDVAAGREFCVLKWKLPFTPNLSWLLRRNFPFL